MSGETALDAAEAERARPGSAAKAVFEVVAASGFPDAARARCPADGGRSAAVRRGWRALDVVSGGADAGRHVPPAGARGAGASARAASACGTSCSALGAGGARAGLVPASSPSCSAASLWSCWRCARAWPALHNVDANPFEALIRSPLDALLVGRAGRHHRRAEGGSAARVRAAPVRPAPGRRASRPRALQPRVRLRAHHPGLRCRHRDGAAGLAWGTMFLWRRSVVAPVVSHAGFNAAQVLQFVVFGG